MSTEKGQQTMNKSTYTQKDIQNLCDTHEWSALEGVGGGRIMVSVYDDSDAFGVFTPIPAKENAYTFRLYKCPSKGETK